MQHSFKMIGMTLCALCSVASLYLAVTHPVEAGGRGGLLVVSVIFLWLAATLARAR